MGNILHFTQALFLKGHVTHGKNLIYHQDFRLQMGGDCKGQADIHSAGIPFHRRVEKLINFSKSHDLVELSFDFPKAHSENAAVHANVFSASELGMKSSSN